MKYKHDFMFPVDWEIKQTKGIRNLYIGCASLSTAFAGVSLYGIESNFEKLLITSSFLLISGCFGACATINQNNLKKLLNSSDFKDAEETRRYLHASEERDQEIIKMVEKDLEKFEKRKLFKRVK